MKSLFSTGATRWLIKPAAALMPAVGVVACVAALWQVMLQTSVLAAVRKN